MKKIHLVLYHKDLLKLATSEIFPFYRVFLRVLGPTTTSTSPALSKDNTASVSPCTILWPCVYFQGLCLVMTISERSLLFLNPQTILGVVL